MGKKKKSLLKNQNKILNDESRYCINNFKKKKLNHNMANGISVKKRNRKKNALIKVQENQMNNVNREKNINTEILLREYAHLATLSQGTNKKFKSAKNKNLLNSKFVSKASSLNGDKLTKKDDFNSLQKQRRRLPIYASRQQILNELRKSQTTIIIGETGSGKTTQIPQFLHEENLDKKGAICITQPRRVAAITIAKRVAAEMGLEIGKTVGYSVRFEDCSSKETKLRYVTDGMLLREGLADPLFMKYKWIILDEAHERSINTDILFGVIKKAQMKRVNKNKPLHIIIMSATMDVDHFSSFFNKAPVLYVQGRQYPVEILVTKMKTSDYVVASLSTMLKIHKEADSEEAILIFLTGQEEIDSAVKLINHIAKDPQLSSFPPLKAYPLYGALPDHKQLKVFKPPCPGERKVIVSTNIAETSITIPGVKYVIDSGYAKIRSYNSTSGFDELKVCKISQAQAWQRTGRAGREAPGVCYRVYTDEDFNCMKSNPVPEILRTNLSSVLLKLLAVGVTNISKFQFIDPPSMSSLKQAKNDLRELKAVNDLGGQFALTDIGRKMIDFPLEPNYAKLLLNAAEYSCTEEILTLIAILSSESIFVNPSDKRDEAKEKREKFVAKEGDHITLLNVFNGFKESENPKVWCRKNFLNFRNLNYAQNVRNQLRDICLRKNISLISCGKNSEIVLRCLISAFYKNIAESTLRSNYKILRSSEIAKIHPSSSLFGQTPDFILFTEVVKTDRTYMHLVSEVNVSWLIDFDAEYFISKHIKKTS